MFYKECFIKLQHFKIHSFTLHLSMKIKTCVYLSYDNLNADNSNYFKKLLKTKF